jgi:imipenem/basic amino acid-specific outer membrane pore
MKFVKKQGEYMKFTKLSLVAALLAGSAAFAIDNVKVSGDAKLFYSTDDAVHNAGAGNNSDSMFDKANSMGEAAVSVGMTADLTKNVSAGVKGTVITTLGLYNNLVSSTWTGGIEDTYVIDEAWLATTMGKTTVKVGRMPLDTPLVFTETWSLVENTFEAGVVINQDIPNTTLVGAYVGQHDSAAVIGGGGLKQSNSPFASFYDGAYAVGVVNNSFKPLTVQGWYYGAQADVNASTLLGTTGNIRISHVDAYWLQADLACQKIPGLLAGAQYTSFKGDLQNAGTISDTKNDAFALMLGYEMKDVATVKVAYSQTGEEKNSLEVGAGFNLATLAGSNGVARGAQSKLYTEAWWNYGYVTRADVQAITVTAEGQAAGIDLGAYYTQTDAGKNKGTAVRNQDLTELTLTASKSYGPLDATLAYVYTKADDQNTQAKDGTNFNSNGTGKAYNTIQAYLTLNF